VEVPYFETTSVFKPPMLFSRVAGAVTMAGSAVTFIVMFAFYLYVETQFLKA